MHRILLIDGPYIEIKPETTRRWIGSTNQKLHFLSDFYEPGIEKIEEAIQYRIEVILNNNRAIINGWPLLYNFSNIESEK